jgi:hypothetical protein
VIAEFVEGFFLLRRYVVLVVFVEPVKEHQQITLSVRHDGPVSTALAPAVSTNAFLDKEAAKPGID